MASRKQEQRPKYKPPITRQSFAKDATPVQVTIGDRSFTAFPKQFSTGSVGWFLGDKIEISVNGTPVKVQVGMNLTVVGSKELPS
jgi:hypothetical protein